MSKAIKNSQKKGVKSAKSITVKNTPIVIQQHRKTGPLQSAGRTVGAAVGSGLGSIFDKIFGSGSYTVKHNTLSAGTMMNGPTSVRVRRSEYIGSVSGSTSFASAYQQHINPANISLFPWLNELATLFEKYRFHGLVFMFKSTSATAVSSTNTALGSVLMATNYNVNDSPFNSKLSMLEYEYSNSCSPCSDMLHYVECAKALQEDLLFIDQDGTSSVDDHRLNDWGQFQLSTVGMQAASVVGELWVTYDVELFYHRLPSGSSSMGGLVLQLHGTIDGTHPMGTANFDVGYSNGPAYLDTAFRSTSHYAPIHNGPNSFSLFLREGSYLVTAYYRGSSGSSLYVTPFYLVPQFTVVDGRPPLRGLIFGAGGSNDELLPGTLLTGNTVGNTACFTVFSPGIYLVTMDTTGNLPASVSEGTIVVSPVPRPLYQATMVVPEGLQVAIREKALSVSFPGVILKEMETDEKSYFSVPPPVPTPPQPAAARRWGLA